MNNIVAIVGRPNVGKSTLFNRLIGARKSIVDDISGVTRDRQYGVSHWAGKEFTVIDTGGFVKNSEDIFETAIREQVDIAIEEARLIVFMTDVKTGITDLDYEIADKLRAVNKPVILVVNKVDNHERLLEANEFWALGFDETFFVSSMTGSGTGDLLDAIAPHLEDVPEDDSDIPKFAVVGQPNAGKSSFVNALIGQERNIVTDIAGTTRDSTNTLYEKFDKKFYLVDTAGLRKKAKVHENLEFYSVMRAIKAIESCDVCFLMIDATLGIEQQDMNIFRIAEKRNKGIVILINKWDLVEKETNTARDYEEKLRKKISPFSDVPIIFISSTEKQRIFKAIETGMKVLENKRRRIKTSELNEYIEEVIQRPLPFFVITQSM
jgi:GTP-binding protein